MTPLVLSFFYFLGGIMREIKIGGIYRHFKGHIYKVVNIGYDSEKEMEKVKNIIMMVN